VHDALGVSVRDGVCHRDEVRQQGEPRLEARTASNERIERAALDELHGVERQAVGPEAGLVDGDDGGVLEARRDERLAHEPPARARTGLGVQLLHRHHSAEPPVAGQQDATHPAPGELPLETVVIGADLDEACRIGGRPTGGHGGGDAVGLGDRLDVGVRDGIAHRDTCRERPRRPGERLPIDVAARVRWGAAGWRPVNEPDGSGIGKAGRRRERRRHDVHRRLLREQPQRLRHASLELGVLPLCHGLRVEEDLDVGRDPLAFRDPLALHGIEDRVAGRSDAAQVPSRSRELVDEQDLGSEDGVTSGHFDEPWSE
jgi:hypothetical protein